MQDVSLNRFIDRMAQLITKYADAVDWNKLPNPDCGKLNIEEKKNELKSYIEVKDNTYSISFQSIQKILRREH